jgi:hypothetical protein
MSKMSKFSLLRPLVMAGAAAAGYAGIRALLGLTPGADEGFFEWTGPTVRGVGIGSTTVDLPIMYYRDDSFMAIFGADYDAVRALLPSPDLFPVMLRDGQATVAVIAFNYMETSIGPYGEIGITLPCTYGSSAPPLLPLLLESRYPGWGAFVQHLPVTTRVARDGGRVVYGYTKFIADMDFQKRPAYQRVVLSEGDAHILTLTVRQGGIPVKDNRPLITYSVLDGEVLKTTVPSRAVYQVGFMPGSGTLELGDHPIAEELRGLAVSANAFITKNYLTRAGILPAGEPVGRAERAHPGHIGRDLDFGRLTVSYDDAVEPIRLHAVAPEV